jgi:hypothetical protein
MFEVTADPKRQLLRIVMRGFWDAETITAYSAAMRRTMGDLQRTAGCRRILIDMVDFAIQSKEVAAGHAAYLRAVRDRSEARVALVMQSALSRLQAARVASDTGHSTFATEAEALAWLMADTPAN